MFYRKQWIEQYRTDENSLNNHVMQNSIPGLRAPLHDVSNVQVNHLFTSVTPTKTRQLTSEQQNLVEKIKASTSNATVVRLASFKDEFLHVFPEMTLWHGSNAYRKLKTHIYDLKMIGSHDPNVGALVYTGNEEKAIENLYKKNTQLELQMSQQQNITTLISHNEMDMLIKCIDQNKRDIVRFIVVTVGGEAARKYYGINLSIEKLNEHLDSLRVQWAELLQESTSTSYIDHKAQFLKIKSKHGGGRVAFEQKEPELMNFILNTAHKSGSLIDSSLNNAELAPHMTLRGFAQTMKDQFENGNVSTYASKSAIYRASASHGKYKKRVYGNRSSIPLTFCRTKKIQVKKHPHHEILLQLHQSIRDFHIHDPEHFIPGQVVLCSYDDLALIPLNAIIGSNGDLWTDLRRDNHAPASDYASGSGQKLCFSTHQILTPQTPVNMSRIDGKRKGIERYDLDQLPFCERYKICVNEANGQPVTKVHVNGKTHYVIKVSDRSGPAIAVIKPWKKENSKHVNWSQPSSGVQHCCDLYQVSYYLKT